MEEIADDMPDLAVGRPRSNSRPGKNTAMRESDAEEELEDLLETMLEDEEELEGPKKTNGQETEVPRVFKVAVGGETGDGHPLSTLPRSTDGTIAVDRLDIEQRKLYNAHVMSLLSEEQMDRYECFRRSSLKEPIRKLIQVVVGSGNPKNTDKVVIALAGVSKVFVGELVEEARRIAEERNEHGPLAPTHIQEAYQSLNNKGLNETAEPSMKRRIRW